MWSRDRLVKPPARNAHAVEPVLVEAVRGGLERQMGDAVAGDFIELAMQRDRIGRRQRSVDGALGRHQSDGADAGRGMTEPLPDLPGKGGNRGLAAGAGHGGDGRGLPRIRICAAASASARRGLGVTTNGTRALAGGR